MQLTSSPLDFARGADHHMGRGLEHLQALQGARGSWMQNQASIRELEAKAAFELAWAVTDLERSLPAVSARDAEVGQRLIAGRDVVQDLVQGLARRTYPINVPQGLVQAYRDVSVAIDLLQR